MTSFEPTHKTQNYESANQIEKAGGEGIKGSFRACCLCRRFGFNGADLLSRANSSNSIGVLASEVYQ
jgi:hypothetical protein